MLISISGATMPVRQVINESAGIIQQAEAERIFERLGPLFAEEHMRIAQWLASKPGSELFGRTKDE
ncbi:MAG: hypothetical protein IT427_20160 [Pirellulales bacterium]|nr:hypothetical protein [Pirellulales bacterium]